MQKVKIPTTLICIRGKEGSGRKKFAKSMKTFFGSRGYSCLILTREVIYTRIAERKMENTDSQMDSDTAVTVGTLELFQKKGGLEDFISEMILNMNPKVDFVIIPDLTPIESPEFFCNKINSVFLCRLLRPEKPLPPTEQLRTMYQTPFYRRYDLVNNGTLKDLAMDARILGTIAIGDRLFEHISRPDSDIIDETVERIGDQYLY